MNSIIARASEKLLQDIWDDFADSIPRQIKNKGYPEPSGISIDYDIQFSGGTLELTPAGTIFITDLKLKAHKVWIMVNVRCPVIEIPLGLMKVKIGGFPLRFPIAITNLCNFRVNIGFSPDLFSISPPSRPVGLSDWEAFDTEFEDHIGLYLRIRELDLMFDVAQDVDDFFESACNIAVDEVLSVLPGWAKKIFKKVLGLPVKFVTSTLGMVESVYMWVIKVVTLDLGDIVQIFLPTYLSEKPFIKIANPMTILPPAGKLIPVLVRIDHPKISISDDELEIFAELNYPHKN